MRAFKKGQMDIWKYDQGVIGEIRLIERQFGVYSSERLESKILFYILTFFATEPSRLFY